MNKIPLYIDCDGVIIDTIETAKKIAVRLGYDPGDYDSMHQYFLHDVNWRQIIDEGGTIGSVVETINKLFKTGKYHMTILTKFSMEKLAKYSITYQEDSVIEECDIDDRLKQLPPVMELYKDEVSEFYKLYFLKNLFPDIPVIFIDSKHHKDDIVQTEGAILVEDEIRNFRRWREKKGIAILFSRGGSENYIYNYREDKKYHPITEEESQYVITDLSELEKNNILKTSNKK